MIISLGLDPRGVKQGMNQAEGMIQSGLSKIGNLVKNIAAPIAGAFAASELFNSYVNGATALDRLSKSLGMDIERLQEWQGAARSAGVDAEEVGNIFRDMNDYITDATRFDSGPLKEIAAQLGISLTDVNGAARNSEAVLLDLADAFQTVGAQEATGYGMQLSFDPGMIALLQQGRGALEDLFRQQRELGIYTKQDAEIAKTFNRELGDLWQSMKAGSAIVLRMIVPAMTKMIDWIERGVKFMREHEKFVQLFFIGLATAITTFALPALAKLAVAAATNPFTLLIAGAAALALVLEDLYVWMNGGEAALGDLWSIFGTPEEVKAGIEYLFELLQSLGKEALKLAGYIADVVAAWWPLIALGTAFAAMVKAFAIAESIFTTVRTAIVGMRTAMLALNAAMLANPIGAAIAAMAAAIALSYVIIQNWDKIKETAVNAWNAVASVIGAKWQEIKDGAAALWESIKGIFNGAVEWFSNLFSAVVGAIVDKFTAAFDKVESLWNGIKGAFGFGEVAGTTGGLNYIGPLGGDAGHAISPASVSNSSSTYTSDTSVNIGKIEVQTQATDAEGISRGIGKGVQDNMAKFAVNQVNTGVRQ